MFENTVDAVKKYWPWALGIVGVGYLILRGSGGSSAPTDNGVIMYDPNLLSAETERLAIQSQSDAALGAAAIQAQAQIETAQLAAVASSFNSLASIHSDFMAGNISTYQAIKEQSIASVNSVGDITSSGLLAAGAAQQAFNNTIGQLGIATGNIVSAVGEANSASSIGFGNVVGSVARAYMFS